MITTTEEPRRTGRILRVAIAASLLVHFAIALLVMGAYDAAARLLHRAPVRQRVPDETVVLSTALRIERRAHAAPTHPHRPPAAAHSRPRIVAQVPRPLVRPVPPAQHLPPQPTPVPTPAARRELAHLKPRATPLPLATAPPTTVPRRLPRVRRAPERVALAPAPPAAAARSQQGTSGRFSDEQLAKIQSDLANAVARDRSPENPLSNVQRPVHPSSVERRSAVNFSGVDGRLHGFEGLCEPLKSWEAAEYVYFYVTCRTMHDDGTVRQEALPWPIRYPARRLSYDQDGPMLPQDGSPIPPPLPGWKPDPGQRLDPDVVQYLRKYGYPI